MKKSSRDQFIRSIDDEYYVHWIVDSLPVGMSTLTDANEHVFTRGFPVGFHTGNTKRQFKHYINNHIRIIIQYHDDEDLNGVKLLEPTIKIVGFRVEPMSIKHNIDGVYDPSKPVSCATGSLSSTDSLQNIDKDGTILFTYDVVWEESPTEWVNRWDAYLYANSSNDSVHWFSITNSFMIVLFLTIMIGMILIRTLRKDIQNYNDTSGVEEAKEESGWKLVHGDIFRPPTTLPMVFSVLVGTGVQLSVMIIATLTFAVLGLLSPANRGSLTSALIMLFVFMGSFAGYYSSMTYKMFRGTDWKQNTIAAAFLYPGGVFLVFFVLNIILWAEGSSGAVPFSTFFTLLFLWFCVSVPLVFIGSFFGYKKESLAFPVRTNQIPRQIPIQKWYLNPILTSLIAGVLPFGAVSVELFFIMSALWLHQIYFIFGFLFLVMIVLVVTCAEISILLCYFNLCNEDHRWWWKSFIHGGSCAGYMFLYAIWYNITELDMSDFVPLLLYTGYMCIFSLTFFIVTGTIGYFACFWFTWKIYSSIKVD